MWATVRQYIRKDMQSKQYMSTGDADNTYTVHVHHYSVVTYMLHLPSNNSLMFIYAHHAKCQSFHRGNPVHFI